MNRFTILPLIIATHMQACKVIILLLSVLFSQHMLTCRPRYYLLTSKPDFIWHENFKTVTYESWEHTIWCPQDVPVPVTEPEGWTRTAITLCNLVQSTGNISPFLYWNLPDHGNAGCDVKATYMPCYIHINKAITWFVRCNVWPMKNITGWQQAHAFLWDDKHEASFLVLYVFYSFVFFASDIAYTQLIFANFIRNKKYTFCYLYLSWFFFSVFNAFFTNSPNYKNI